MPLFTSTHITTALRAAVRAARSLPRASKAKAIKHVQVHIHDARLAINRLALETFPSLSTHHQSVRALEPIHLHLGGRSYRPMSTHARLRTAGQTFRTGAGIVIPPAMRSGGTASRVGLGSARGFASGAGAGGHVQNVPMVLRAFASLIDDEHKSLPRPTRYMPYNPRRTRVRRVRAASTSTRISEFSHYFPFPALARSQSPVTLPPTAETLVTPGTTATLSLPLSPSLSALLDPTPRVPFADAQVGIAVLSTLTEGVVSLHHAFSLHFADRILPLLAHIDALGVVGPHPGGARYEVMYDPEGQPDILRIIFNDRSVNDVRTLLGERLYSEGWYALYEADKGEPIKDTAVLSVYEQGEMMEDWTGVTRENHSPELVMPVLDASVSLPTTHQLEDTWSSPSSCCTPISGLDYDIDVGDFSQHSSPVIASPSSYGSYGSHGSYTSSTDSGQSLTASLLSQLSASSPSSGEWAVPPSQDDSDVESTISAELIGELSEVWDVDAVEDLVAMRGNGGSEWSGSAYIWAGSGEGFGLAQPW